MHCEWENMCVSGATWKHLTLNYTIWCCALMLLFMIATSLRMHIILHRNTWRNTHERDPFRAQCVGPLSVVERWAFTSGQVDCLTNFSLFSIRNSWRGNYWVMINSNGKTVLVTGGAGYIGSHCVVTLQEAGYKVIALDNFANSVNGDQDEALALKRVEKITGQSINFYKCDLLDTDHMDKIFRLVSIVPREKRLYGINESNSHYLSITSIRWFISLP